MCSVERANKLEEDGIEKRKRSCKLEVECSSLFEMCGCLFQMNTQVFDGGMTEELGLRMLVWLSDGVCLMARQGGVLRV